MAKRVALPNGSIVSVATGLGAENAFSAISNAAPPVVSDTAHGFVDGDILLIDSGWSRIAGKAARVINSTTDSYALEGLDTTNVAFFAPGSGAGTVQEVSGWVDISKVTGVSLTGGEQQYLTVGYLESQDDFQLPINRDPLSMSLTIEDQPEAVWVPIVEGYDQQRSIGVIRITFPDESVMLFPGYITITSTPTLERNQLMTRTIGIAMTSTPVRYIAP